MKKRRAPILSLLALALLFCVASGLVMRGYWREQASRELILAIKANDTGRALDALRAGADPNVREQNDATPSLFSYLSKLWLQVLGINPPSSSVGQKALTLAVTHNNTVIVEALLDQGAKDIGETIEIPETAKRPTPLSLSLLMVAAENKNPAIVRELVKHGWKVDSVNENEETALFYAADAATVKTLVTYRANIDAKDIWGSTVLDHAMKDQPDDVVDALLDLGALGARTLTYAVRLHRTEPLNRMFDLGWKSDIPDEEGSTPLMVALNSGGSVYPDEAWRFLKRRANVNFRDNQGNTPLILAADGGIGPQMIPQSPGIVQALLDRGAQVNVQNKEGHTPLMAACYELRPTIVRILLQHGARVNLRTREGKTALSMARHCDYRDSDDGSQSEVITMLKKAGAKE